MLTSNVLYIDQCKVMDAGHMVPMDQPAVSLRMISAFIQRKPLQDGLSPLGVADPIRQECSSRHLAAPLSDVSHVDPGVVGGGNFAPVIAHTYPLQDGIQVRIRLQHLTHLADLTIERTLLRVEPGSYLIPLHELAFNSSHASVEVKLTGLSAGQKYTLQVERMNKESTASHRPTRRTHEVTVGCYRAGYSQCCHHGVCEAHADGPKCQCDPGYSGEFCNRYIINSHKYTDNTTFSSGDSGQCGVHLQPVAMEWNVKSLSSSHSLLLGQAPSSICNTTEAKQDCCLELEAAMAISSGLAEHWSATAALLEHDLTAALRQSTTNVRVFSKKVQGSSSDLSLYIILCGERSLIVEAAKELDRQLRDSSSPLRKGVVSSRLHAQELLLLRNGTSANLLPSKNTQPSNVSPRQLLGPISWWWLLLPLSFLCCFIMPLINKRGRPDRLP